MLLLDGLVAHVRSQAVFSWLPASPMAWAAVRFPPAEYSHHLCEGSFSSQSAADSGADEFGLIELLAVSVISKICRKSEDQGDVETKYMPLRR